MTPTDIVCAPPLVAYLASVREALSRLDVSAIQKAARVLLQARERGAQVYVIGNGGSQATAAHMAADLLSQGVRAQALDSLPALTAVANDYGYVQSYSHPLDTLSRAGDVLVVLSVSGASPNVVDAIHTAVSMEVIGVFGEQAPEDTRELCDVCVIVPSRSYEVVEDCAAATCHALKVALRMAEPL